MGSGSVSKFSSRYREARTVSEAGMRRQCHGARQFSRFTRSERVNECEASENAETRLVTGAGLLVHTF